MLDRQFDGQPEPRVRLATLAGQLPRGETLESLAAWRRRHGADGDGAHRKPEPSDGKPKPVDGAGRLVRRWVPGGDATVRVVGDALHRHRGFAVGAVLVVIAAVVAALSLHAGTPSAESPPALPAASVDTGPSTGLSTSAPTASSASGAAGKIVISVVGKVTRPGLVTLPDGARVADAVRAAGGALAGTDVTALNMARKLTDGEQIYVGIPIPPQAGQPVDTGVAGDASSTDAQSTVDLNTATEEQLDALPGIGQVTAKRIIDWRTQHGRFTSVDELQQVDGIGPTKFAQLKGLVTAQ